MYNLFANAKEFCLTAEVEVGDDDEEIRDDDGDGDHEDKARLHESLQRVLLHAATFSSCIPPPALRCFYPSLFLRSFRCQMLDLPGSLYLQLLHELVFVTYVSKTTPALLERNV